MLFSLITALIVLDQVSKWWAASTFPLNGANKSIGLGFHFTYVQNTGAAFGILENTTLILGILSATVAAVLAFFLLTQHRSLNRLAQIALNLILAGALGNMIDRFRLGYVIDFIHFYLPNFNFPVFNVADSCVVIGAGLLVLSSLSKKRTLTEANTDLLNDPSPPPS